MALENMNPKHNPVTTLLGILFILLSGGMYVVKYVIPAFVVLKQDLPYPWWGALPPFALGVILLFINDDYFAKIFQIGTKVVEKKTGTDGN